jgi:2-polyprenyl-3-methyl-5-hydroxy-6-metoxy-1,4-benzoquinol methylase
MLNFLKRSTHPELMDQPSASESEIIQALQEIELINKKLGGFNVTISALENLKLSSKKLKIIDLGSGGGDMLRKINLWAIKRKLETELVGIDFNSVMTKYATQLSTNYNNIEFKTLNVFDEKLLLQKYDIVMSTLFCHHFDDDELVKLIIRMNKIATKSVIINDLHRHWFAYYAIKFLTSIFSKTYLVKYDAALSVARSLTRIEWGNILSKASITNYRIKWMWAWRWQIVIEK